MPLKALHPYVIVRKYSKPAQSGSLLLPAASAGALTICEVIDLPALDGDLSVGNLVIVDSEALSKSIEDQGAKSYFVPLKAIYGKHSEGGAQ